MKNSSNSLKSLLELDLSDDFRQRAASMNIHCLQDVFNQELNKLKAHPEFNYLWYTDLLNLLKKEGLLDEFQDRLLK
jgi:hypothetical protein